MQQQQYDNVSPLNDLADQQMAQYIADSLKQNDLSNGQEFSAQDLEQIITTRYPGVNYNIGRIAIDLIMNDAANMKSRVDVAGGSYKDFKLSEIDCTRSPCGRILLRLTDSEEK